MRFVRNVFMAMVIVGLMVSVSLAATTATIKGPFIELTLDSTDWDSKVSLPGGVEIDWITVSPSAATDVIQLREGSATGVFITPKLVFSSNLDPLVLYFGEGTVHPYLKFADCTLGTQANVRITIKMR